MIETKAQALRIINDYNKVNIPNRIKVQTVVMAEQFLKNGYKPKKQIKYRIVKRVLKSDIKPIIIQTNNVDLILDKICDYIAVKYDITSEQLKMRSRKIEYMRPRQVVQYFASEHGVSVLDKIGCYFNCDHSTVMSNRRVIKDIMDYDKEFEVFMNVLRYEIVRIIDEHK